MTITSIASIRLTQDSIVAAIGTNEVTHDQLLALCNTGASKPLASKELARVLRILVKEGRIAHAWDASVSCWRYRRPCSRYRLRQVIDVWAVDRAHPDIADHWNQIVTATESEARVCKAALELFMCKLENQIAEFKARALKPDSQRGR
jgi:hypothetical protein